LIATTTHPTEPHVTAAGGGAAAQGGFVRWWLDELRAALPRRVRRRASASPRAFLLRRYGGSAGGEAIEVFRRRGGAAERVGALDLPPPFPAPAGAPAAGGPALLAPESRRLVELLAKRRAPVVLLLEESEGLLCADRLPAGAAGELDRIMPHRVDLLTPWPAARVRWGYRVLGAGRQDGGQVEVLLGVAPRAVVDPAVARLAAYGVPVDAVDLIGEDGDPAGIDLLAAHTRRREPPGAAARAVRRAGVLALALLTAGGAALAGVELHRLNGRLEQRQQYLRALEERMADLPGLQARIEALRRDAGFVPAQQARTPSPVVVLEVLSRILPDSIWLDEVSLEGEDLTLSGYAEDAAQVLPIVEGSAHFAQVRFSAPSTRVSVAGPGGGTREVERFSLAAKVAPLAEPVEP
jgi:general secretion pathway protein L